VETIAKNSKSLLNVQSSKQKKKQDKYSEIPEVKKKSKSEFKFKQEDIVIYTGNVIPENHGKECKIIKLRNKYNQEYYLVEFNNGETLECHIDFLKSKEEYRLDKLNQTEPKSSEIKQELIEKGIESYDNDLACLNPVKYYEMSCEQCSFEERCSYHSKGVYKKLSF
jgi:phage protein U